MDIFHYLQQTDQYVYDAMQEMQQKYSVKIADVFVDHICMRVDSGLLYHFVKSQFMATQSQLLCESEIGGRMVSVFDFPLLSLAGIQHDTLIELSAPKPNHNYGNGWQHIELVVPNVDDLLRDYPHLVWDMSGYKKEYNRDISLVLEGNHEVKFHEQPLRLVLEKEMVTQ